MRQVTPQFAVDLHTSKSSSENGDQMHSSCQLRSSYTNVGVLHARGVPYVSSGKSRSYRLSGIRSCLWRSQSAILEKLRIWLACEFPFHL